MVKKISKTRSEEFHYQWNWILKATPEQLWPYLSDTNRFDRDAGFPAVRTQLKDPDGRNRFFFHQFGIKIEWEEDPFEWMAPFRFGVIRRYQSGPMAYLRVLAQLIPLSKGSGTQVRYEVWVKPANLLGQWAIPIQIGKICARKFQKVAMQYDRLAVQNKPLRPAAKPLLLTPSVIFKLLNAKKELGKLIQNPQLAEQLTELLKSGDELSLERMRPYSFADLWGQDRRIVLEMFLHATKMGLLELQWEVLCPHCRGTGNPFKHLNDLNENHHCKGCQIDFRTNFERLVEVTFSPHPSIRRLVRRRFCIGSPQMTPHVLIQLIMQPGEKYDLLLNYEKGRYRLRSKGRSGDQLLTIQPQGAVKMYIPLTNDSWPNEEILMGKGGMLTIDNQSGKEQIFVLERIAWADQAATAAEVIRLQLFRDLFSNEAVRSGAQFGVGNLTIVFTDLRASTQLYHEMGDGPAFGYVLNHFDVLKEMIQKYDGTLVKTIGDAVMAVFIRPAAAVKAIIEAQQKLQLPTNPRPLYLRAGIHHGQCLAVTLNDRLDYFGEAVNIAARLASLSSGEDVVVSDNVAKDSEASELFSSSQQLHVRAFDSKLKGFGDIRFDLWRINGQPTETLAPNGTGYGQDRFGEPVP